MNMNISISQISKLISGDDPCLFKYWYAIRHKDEAKKEDLSADLVKWRIRHNQVVSNIIEDVQKSGGEFKREKWVVLNLSENDALVGKADIIHENDKSIHLYECKGGQPSSSDAIQLLIYLYVLTKEESYKNKELKGILGYKDYQKEYSITDIPEGIQELIDKYSKILISDSEPLKYGGSSCRFCSAKCEFKRE